MLFYCIKNDELNIKSKQKNIVDEINNIHNIVEESKMFLIEKSLESQPYLYSLFVQRYKFLKNTILKFQQIQNNKNFETLLFTLISLIPNGLKTNNTLIKSLYNDILQFKKSLKKSDLQNLEKTLQEECYNSLQYYINYLNQLIEILYKNTKNSQLMEYYIFQKIIISPYTIPIILSKTINIIQKPEKTTNIPIIDELNDYIETSNYCGIIKMIAHLNSLDEIWIGEYRNIWTNLADFLTKNESTLDVYEILIQFFELLKNSQIPINSFTSQNPIINKYIQNIITILETEEDNPEQSNN